MLVPGVGGKYSRFQVTGMIKENFGIQTFSKKVDSLFWEWLDLSRDFFSKTCIKNNPKTRGSAWPHSSTQKSCITLHLFYHGIFLGLIFGPRIFLGLVETYRDFGGFDYFAHWITLVS